MNEIVRWHVSTGMRPTDPDERIRVRVNYVPRGYGLALTIREDGQQTVEHGDDAVDDGYLTVVESGVTTLELRRPDGQSSYLIWDQAEVDWACLQAG